MNLTIRQHDIVADELEQDRYDLVHCRALLLHLADPVTALHRMIAALRPGGLLLVEDAEFTCFGAVPGHPASACWDRLVKAMRNLQTGATFDPRFGAKLPGLLAQAGLVERGEEALRFVRSGGSQVAELYERGFEMFRGRLPSDDFTEALRALRDPTFSFVDSLNVAAWGRRPMTGYLG
jgi:2-polyprenyl-3-methyl-5-hydroxy-6-metoxy-1,4-benzoquinol methylase